MEVCPFHRRDSQTRRPRARAGAGRRRPATRLSNTQVMTTACEATSVATPRSSDSGLMGSSVRSCRTFLVRDPADGLVGQISSLGDRVERRACGPDLADLDLEPLPRVCNKRGCVVDGTEIRRSRVHVKRLDRNRASSHDTFVSINRERFSQPNGLPLKASLSQLRERSRLREAAPATRLTRKLPPKGGRYYPEAASRVLLVRAKACCPRCCPGRGKGADLQAASTPPGGHSDCWRRGYTPPRPFTTTAKLGAIRH